LRLRAEVFERRLEVYEATSNLLGELLVNGAMPGQATQDKFLLAMKHSRLIFAPEVHTRLQDIWSKVLRYGVAVGRLNDGARRQDSVIARYQETEAAVFEEFGHLVGDLESVFGNELQLSDDPATLKHGMALNS
jgi:hypothetical protein